MEKNQMKRILIIAIIFLLSILRNFGQENKKVSFQFDIGTTVTVPYVSSIDGQFSVNYKSNLGYFAEVLSIYHVNEKLSLISGLNYKYISYKISYKIAHNPYLTTQGPVDNTNISYSKAEGSFNNSYLNIPFMFNYRFYENISISAGLYSGLLLFAKEKWPSSDAKTALELIKQNEPNLERANLESNYNIKEDYYNIDYGLLIQLGYEFKLNDKLSGVILSRFNYGLKNVLSSSMDKPRTGHNLANKWKNYNISIGIGLKIR
jgi:hypothetical protein